MSDTRFVELKVAYRCENGHVRAKHNIDECRLWGKHCVCVECKALLERVLVDCELLRAREQLAANLSDRHLTELRADESDNPKLVVSVCGDAAGDGLWVGQHDLPDGWRFSSVTDDCVYLVQED